MPLALVSKKRPCKEVASENILLLATSLPCLFQNAKGEEQLLNYEQRSLEKMLYTQLLKQRSLF